MTTEGMTIEAMALNGGDGLHRHASEGVSYFAKAPHTRRFAATSPPEGEVKEGIGRTCVQCTAMNSSTVTWSQPSLRRHGRA